MRKPICSSSFKAKKVEQGCFVQLAEPVLHMAKVFREHCIVCVCRGTRCDLSSEKELFVVLEVFDGETYLAGDKQDLVCQGHARV